ncbi:MAG: bifunctional transaldolase/phosoglucose isomerase [Chloroflexi bacterium]|nr:bifunctional transaldolase/phosoglucose isomerase [Ardenticatenaceae bacterium]MBL1129410.1 bifunctional transaldolase/phosoglucose isomerase [Chloroflexota bacterium]NOG35490.1 bifunctional transaldolase/phosoglucose isomerase [Chloroflexota bacterium]GIK57439.1 MAG: glucose-6-phosphate isomerase [Chloroflexota bacterium]
MTKLHELTQLGQSIWYDNVRRALIHSGELQALLHEGVTGVTSNPSIFEKAIAGSADYDEAIRELAGSAYTDEQIYEFLVLEDIQHVADLLRRVYESTGGADGYVSLEVSPMLAHNTAGTIAAARRLFAALERPNVMIKVPATPAGIPAIETLISEGINVNVTLIFSLSHYEVVAEAYLAGLEKRAAHGGDLSRVASVASFFISRVDTAVDDQLAAAGNGDLQGKIGIANAKVAYGRFRQIFSGPRWAALAEKGARVQRPLWASTGVKNPAYPDTLYVDQLIGSDTVNTVPPATLTAFRRHGTVAAPLGKNLVEAADQLAWLAALGIDLKAITQQLQDDGLAAFARSFDMLIASIGEKRHKLQNNWQGMTANLGPYQVFVDAALKEIRTNRIFHRIWGHDHTVWKSEPAEIGNRLGWLHSTEMMQANCVRLQALTQSVLTDGYSDVLLMGMGGSSLAPEVFAKTFGGDGLRLSVLDSTDPGRVLELDAQLDPAKTLYIVSTKSGGTVETFSFFKYFYNRVVTAVGVENAGHHFVAITDPGSKLAEVARQHRFRYTLINDPNIGGRYAALSYFGLFPAALVGVNLDLLLERAATAAANAASCNCPIEGDNNAGRLGAMMGELAKAGRDKLTIFLSPAIASFGDWVEQLIAESTGKDGLGILPVVGEPVGPPEVYGADRFFVYLQLDGDTTYDAALDALAKAGHPVVRLHLQDVYDLGGQFFLWEMATAVAGQRLHIQPFDQPNVEAAKILARQMVAAYTETGALPAGQTAPITPDALQNFLAHSQPGDYIAIHAYVHPTAATDAALLNLRTHLRDQYKLATTVGYGPRFLHSTGQLHKGDGGNGLFIQFSGSANGDAPIPDEAGRPESSMSFGVLKQAQALGDAQALLEANRRVIRFDLGQDVNGRLASLS